MTDSPDAPLPGPHQAAVLAVIAAGGAFGAVARYGLAAAVPTRHGGFPWATLTINLSGCLLIGVLMAFVAARRRHPLVRPMLGTGVLGGYTTFSTYAVELRALIGRSMPLAGAYAVATVVGALAATALAFSVTSHLLRMGARP